MKSGLTVSKILKNSATWHVIFILIILYCVSSINVLILAVAIIPFLQRAYLDTNVLKYYALISLGFAGFLCLYHLSTMFRQRKRSQDKTEAQNRVNIITAWKRSRIIAKIISISVVLYVFFSVYVLLWELKILPKILEVDDNIFWVIYSITSFALTTFIAGFHMATLILRQKRASDLLNHKQRSGDK